MTSQTARQAMETSPAEGTLHTVNSRVVIDRVAQIRPGHRAEALGFVRQQAARTGRELPGQAGSMVFEEMFGVRDRVHFLTFLDSLDGQEQLQRLAEEARPGSGPDEWNRLFVESSQRETVLMPQFWGMYGTKVDGEIEKQSDMYQGRAAVGLPPARQQTALPLGSILDSTSAGIVIHRKGQMASEYRSQARQFGRVVAESINRNLPGECSVFVYEEAFGQADQLHWLIHLKDIDTYMRLMELHVRDEEVREIYFRDWIPAEQGGGTWARLFLDGTMSDVALTALR